MALLSIPLNGQENERRLASAVAVAAVHVLIGWLLVSGLAVRFVPGISDQLKTFDVATETAAPPMTPAPVAVQEAALTKPSEREGRASPKSLRAEPSPIATPKPRVALPVPPTVAVAPLPAEGAAATAGSAILPGPGSGSGGLGNGRGSGSAGDGTGGGGGVAIPAQRIRGGIGGRDYPREAYAAHAQGTVFVKLAIGADGRVKQCVVDESSGHPELDRTTCALIVKRFRYKPARDAQGNRVPDTVYRAQVWETRERQ